MLMMVWCCACLHLPRSLRLSWLQDLPYLHGVITREEAEGLLRGNGLAGTYLLRARDGQSKSFAYSCLGNEGKIIHSKVDFTATGISIDNKDEPQLREGAPLDQVVAFLNTTRKNLGLVVGMPLERGAGAGANSSYTVSGDGGAAPAAAQQASGPTGSHPVSFNKIAIVLRKEPVRSLSLSCSRSLHCHHHQHQLSRPMAGGAGHLA